MADILIKGLDMPTKGNPLTVLIYPDGTATWKDHEYQAVPVPPHGRLIDADALKTALMSIMNGQIRKLVHTRNVPCV